MNRPTNYSLATNTAYKALIGLNIKKLPVDLFSIIDRYKTVSIKSYSQVCMHFGMSYEEYISTTESEHGFLYRHGGKYIIVYNDNKCHETVRFTIAHELGHIFLSHEDSGEESDKEANCFARNFLRPVPIAKEWKLTDPYDCAEIFDISPFAAQASCDFAKSDCLNISDTNYAKTYDLFGLSSLSKDEQLKRFRARERLLQVGA